MCGIMIKVHIKALLIVSGKRPEVTLLTHAIDRLLYADHVHELPK